MTKETLDRLIETLKGMQKGLHCAILDVWDDPNSTIDDISELTKIDTRISESIWKLEDERE